MKEIIFHPEARAEMRESVEFYEARLDGLGLRFLSAVEQTTERITAHPEAGAPLGGEFRKRIVPGFPYNVIYRVWDDYIYLVAVANHWLEEALRSPQPHRLARSVAVDSSGLQFFFSATLIMPGESRNGCDASEQAEQGSFYFSTILIRVPDTETTDADSPEPLTSSTAHR